MRRARARKEAQRGQRPEAQRNRVCSALTQVVMWFERRYLNVHRVSQVGKSGQLPDLGSIYFPNA